MADFRTIDVVGLSFDSVLVYSVVLTVWCAILLTLFCATGHPFLALLFAACFLVVSGLVGVNWGRLAVARLPRQAGE